MCELLVFLTDVVEGKVALILCNLSENRAFRLTRRMAMVSNFKDFFRGGVDKYSDI